jgi:superfamily I DNA/RNA helicase/RecB family exonuclease
VSIQKNSKLNLLRQPPPQSIIFDEVQQKVINHRGSPLVVIGGPGVGKSATLVARAQSYLAEGVKPDHILVLTYDRHRASELNDQIFSQSDRATSGSLVKTFPALAFAILRLHRARAGKNPPRLLAGPEQEYFIRELLAGAAEANLYQWPEQVLNASQTSAFARELRDLISRATEHGITPEELRAMSEREKFPLWAAASNFYVNYRELSGLSHENAFDSSEMIYQATLALENDREFREDIRSRHQVILVDEFHESDPAHRKFLEALYSDELTLYVDPDSAIGRFRGADPESIPSIFDRYRDSRGNPTNQIILTTDYRGTRAITDLGVALAQGFSLSRMSAHRLRSCAASELINEGATEISRPIALAQCESVHDEARLIAQHFQGKHLREGIPYGEMAVIIRSPSTRATTLRRVFASLNIPVREEIQSLPLNKQPAVAPLITLASLSFALAGKTLSNERAEELLPSALIDELLLSRYGGADFLTLKRIRASLINSRSVDDVRTSHQIIREYLITSVADLEWSEFAPIKRISDLLHHGKSAVRPGATSEDVLWALWSSAKDEDGAPLAQRWQRDAIEGDENADRDLDGVLALFEAAARYTDQRPGNTGNAFIKQLINESIASDTIAARTQRHDVVSILTTHAAKGREWSVVAVAGVEEGVWPNLTPRGSLLGSERLVESQREGSAADRTSREYQLAALSALKDDERRLFYNAITRAKSSLLITTTVGDEARPSQFFNEVAESLNIDEEELSSVERRIYLTPARLVGALREEAEGADATRSHEAISILAYLHQAGIRVANPDSWYGAREISTAAPLFSDTEKISLSPSSLDTLHKCPLKWAFEYSGGRDSDSTAQIIGTTFHALAAKLKDGATLTALQNEMEALWNQLNDQLDLGSGWSAKAERDRALNMLEKVFQYHHSSERELLAVEKSFTITIGKIKISGSVDRLEITSDGQLYVVDLKTSKNAISKAEALENPQLAVYQLAISEGAFTELTESKASAGAELFYPSVNKEGAIRLQRPMTGDDVKKIIENDGATVASSEFLAIDNKLCEFCALRTSCPVRPEGRTLR